MVLQQPRRPRTGNSSFWRIPHWAFDFGGATKAYKEKIEELQEENDALAKKLGKTTIERDWLEKS